MFAGSDILSQPRADSTTDASLQKDRRSTDPLLPLALLGEQMTQFRFQDRTKQQAV
jgi:hypothetical protein